jgi:hypothetical protein
MAAVVAVVQALPSTLGILCSANTATDAHRLDGERSKIMSTERSKLDALTDTELDAVSGGVTPAPTPKLHEAACKGTHLPEVVIEVW